MRLKEFLDQVRDLPPDTLLCVAELDEAFAMNIATVEDLETAKPNSQNADGVEAVDLVAGDERAIVIRW